MSTRETAGGGTHSGQAASGARRWAVSPLLVDNDIPRSVVEASVDTTQADGDELIAVLIELNLHARTDPDHVRAEFLESVLPEALEHPDAPRPKPFAVSTAYIRCLLSRAEIHRLLKYDENRAADLHRRGTIFRIWPDYIIRPLIDRSVSTVKADAAVRTYGADGTGIVWAVIDTGIDGNHPHFSDGILTGPDVEELHRDFTYIVRNEPAPDAPRPQDALRDENGHGSHVAGIISGRLPDGCEPLIANLKPSIGDGFPLPRWEQRTLDPNRTLTGMAPRTRLVSLKVMENAGGVAKTTSSAVIAALEHIRRVNAWGRSLRIHGVNLSLGCPWYYQDYAAGQSPLCRELNLLVGTGVVAVVSAGNSGYAQGTAAGGAGDLHGMLSTITDPANAERAISVGATHRDKPHTFGVTYLSSKGPTLDGRLKPDLVAPGERITSCASGTFRQGIPVLKDDQDSACYAEDTGTSMAAPHVSGAIAAFLSARREFIGLPDDVKRLFCETAISLGRDRFFEGNGLVDLMGAMSKI
ncbi:S8 family peptidase [Nonomuraea sp. M3C6]|uniref:S8 family peptidase n=1 Tax=Nonomuraea marmarensis TaxID=3351344 RepID=A0ABW7AU94_9ACTN